MPQPWYLIAHRRGIHWRIGLQVFVLIANQAEQLLEADELLQEGVGVAGQVSHAHQLDETQLIATFQAVFEQRHHLVQVLPAQRHHIDLDLHSGGPGLLHAVEHGRQVAATGDTAKRGGVQGVEGNVDATDTGIHQQGQFFASN